PTPYWFLLIHYNADKKRHHSDRRPPEKTQPGLPHPAGSRDGLKAVKFRSRKASDGTGSIPPPPGHQKWTQKKSSATRQARSAARF
ncbi:TPA: hypothetical protein ACWYE2_000574, partial [Neisseria meningitidis]